MTPEEFYKEQRVPKYRQRLVAALICSITSEDEEKAEFYSEIADFEALEFSTKQVEAARKDVRRILKIRG